MSQSDFVHRGQALVSAGQYQEAVKVCRLGLLGRPTTVEGRVVLGQALLALKRYDEVLAEMRVALELDHQAVAAHALKGEALLRKGDRHAAIEALERAKTIAPDDQSIIRLLMEAERVPGGISAAQSAVNLVENTAGTRNYPGRQGSQGVRQGFDSASDDEEDTNDGYTGPASPSAKRASGGQPLARGPVRGTPPDAVLEVGDKSGTVEVDPELEGVELDEVGVAITPPRAQQVVQDFEAARGKVARSRKDKPTQQARPQGGSQPVPAQRPLQVIEKAGPMTRQPRANTRDPRDSIEELDSADIEALDEPSAQPSHTPSGVRNAVNMPPGPLTVAISSAPAGPASLAQAIAKAPHVIEMTPIAGTNNNGLKSTRAAAPAPMPARPAPTGPVQSPPMAPQPMPAPMPMPRPMPMPGPLPPEQPSWAVAAMMAQPPPMQARAASPTAATPLESGVVVAVGSGQAESTRDQSRSGVRRSRSKLAIAMWVVIGAAVIGGGVFAGFQIRAMRLDSQIDAAREHAVEQAQPDTWTGWTASRDSLASIVAASSTPENRAALARVKGLLAYELGDSVADAKATVEALKGVPGLDADIAAAYVSLALDDVKSAKQHADAAIGEGSDDAEAIYVEGLAQVLGGDYATGLQTLQSSLDKVERALPAASLGRALADVDAWDQSLAVIDKALKAFPDHPALVIARARTLVLAGRIAPTSAGAAEVGAAVDKVVTEGGKSVADQPHGVSPSQVAFATLVQMRVEYARANPAAEQAARRTLGKVAVDDDQRFAEETVETFAAIGDTRLGKSTAERALAIWPQSRRSTIALASLELAAGAPLQALDTLKKVGDATTLPGGLVVRAEARLASNDIAGARADYQTAVKRLASYEPALIGLVALDLKTGDLAGARALVDKAVGPTPTPTPALVVAYASVLRAAHDLAARDKAKDMLEKIVRTASGPDLPRAQLELARIYREENNLKRARDLYAEASKTGNLDARLESALLAGEQDPYGGRDSLERLAKEVGSSPPANLLVELGHARMMVGDHDAAEQALDAAEHAMGEAPRWPIQRERARLALRRGDLPGAAALIQQAIDGCGDDAETFLVAADIAATDIAATAPGAKSSLGSFASTLRATATTRLGNRPEAFIVTGILALAAGKDDDAKTAYGNAKAALGKQAAPERLDERIQYGLAVVAYDSKTGDAKNYFDYVISLDAANYQAFLYEIDILRDSDPKKALEYARTVVRLDPDSVYGWYYLGLLGKQQQQDKLLVDAIQMVTQLAPGSEVLKELLAKR